MNNRINPISPCNFQGNYTVYGKQNKKVDFLYNKVVNAVNEHKVPSVFFLGPEDKIVLSPSTEKSENLLLKTLKNLGIKFSKEAEK